MRGNPPPTDIICRRPQHPTYGTYLHSLGELDLKTRDLKSAETNLSHVLDIYKLQPGHRFLPLVLYELAEVNALQGRTQQALRFLEDAVGKGYKPDGASKGLKDSSFASLRGNPRFEAMVSEVNNRRLREPQTK